MNVENKDVLNEQIVDERISIRNQVEKYLVHWKWFLLSVLIFFLYSYYNVRKTVPQYKVTSSILIKDDSKSTLSELSAFEDLNVLKSNKSGVEDEIEILRSRTLMTRVIKELKLNIEYISTGYLRTKELYKNSPVAIEFLNDSLAEITFLSLEINVKSAKEFEILKDGKITNTHNFNEWLALPQANIKLNTLPNISQFIGREFTIRVRPVEHMINGYKGQVNIYFPSKTSRLIELEMVSANTEKAKDIIDNLVDQYNADALNDKNQISKNTAEFIEKRLVIIDDSLFKVEQNEQSFKQDNNLVDLTVESGINLERKTENQNEQLNLETELKLIEFMEDNISGDELKLIPAKIGLSDPITQANIDQYNTLFLRRQKDLESVGPLNPIIVNYEAQLNLLKSNLRKNLNNLKQNIEISLSNLESQGSQFQGNLSQIPQKERLLRDITRQQKIKESLYIYLLEKREETAIALAVNVANAKIIDKAYESLYPVSPDKKSIYIRAIIIGLIVPFIIIFIKNLLDTKVRLGKDLESRLNKPILGEIPKSQIKGQYVIEENDRSTLAESFRLLDTNLEFLLSDLDNKCKTILITSTISKEGKTSISINSGLTLAHSGHKVLLMEMDLRAPKVQRYLEMSDSLGITNFIKDKSLNLSDITQVSDYSSNFHIIPSGDIPPNPTDILKTKRLQELIELASVEYDYIIIDTAPVSLVPDTLLLSKFADLCIYVVRANYLDKRMLKYPEMLIKENRFENLAFVVNSVARNKGYGYGYGYGYGQEKPKPWYKRLLNKIS